MSKLPTASVNPQDSQLVANANAKKQVPADRDHSYTHRDVILYNLGVGVTEHEHQWIYEGHDKFSALPTFGVIPQFEASVSIPLEWLPNFNPANLMQAEHFLSIKAPIPTEGNVMNESRLLEVLDKGKGAFVTILVLTRDKVTGQALFENQSTFYIRGAGGFGGKRTGADRGAATAANIPPNRVPDAVMEEKTFSTQAALFRINGDSEYDALHILPEVAAIAGFEKPILPGLCSMGIAGKHVIKTYGAFMDIKVRFAGVVYPGETLVTEMWKQGNKVIFTMKSKERGTIVLANAAVTLVDEDKSKL